MSKASDREDERPAPSGLARRSEWLEVIATSTEDAIVGRDLEGRITFWNEAATRIFGYLPDEVVGRRFDEVLPALNPADDEIISRSLAHHQSLAEYDQVRLGKGDKPVGVGLTIAPVHGLDGLSLGTVMVLRDISERRRVAAQLARADILATLGAVAKSTVQRVEPPLARARRILESLSLEDAPASFGVPLAEVHGALADALKALERLARLSAPEDEYTSPVELSSVIESAIRWSAVTLQSGARLRTELTRTAIVRADPMRLSQMFVHLLNHAADAVSSKLPASERLVEVSLHKVDSSHARVEITNNGLGFAKDESAQLFDFIFADKPARHPERRGLAVARLIAERADGSIEIESRPQGPTVFRVHLPCAVSAYSPTEAQPIP